MLGAEGRFTMTTIDALLTGPASDDGADDGQREALCAELCETEAAMASTPPLTPAEALGRLETAIQLPSGASSLSLTPRARDHTCTPWPFYPS